MHQFPRSLRAAAGSPRSQPSRTNNDRDDASSYSSSFVLSDERTAGDEDQGESGELVEERRARKGETLNRLIRNFYVKGAIVILSARTILPQAFKDGRLKVNHWFNLEMDDTSVLKEPMRDWYENDVNDSKPPNMLIEVYIDLEDLNPNQALVIYDDQDNRWNVEDSLNPPTQTQGRPPSRSSRTTQIILERWKLKVGREHEAFLRNGLNDDVKELPWVYKNACVTFRSLYTQTLLLPTWKYYRRILKSPTNHPSLKLKYRISNGDFKSPRRDTLETPLYPSHESVTEKFTFSSIKSPCGDLSISVAYRSNCDFRVHASETLLSSHFMHEDGRLFGPSLGRQQKEPVTIPGSLPVRGNRTQDRGDPSQAYGSMSTFHGAETGTSPISALRAVRDLPDSPSSPPQKTLPYQRLSQGAKPTPRPSESSQTAYQRRTSVTFQSSPFKAGSLASSPAGGFHAPGSPGSSIGRNTNLPPSLTQPRNRTSLNALPQAALRTPASIPNETAIASSASSSPKPAPISRYSSSFSHRKSRFSSGGASKTEDDNNSSGKGSLNSSAQRGSDTVNDGSAGSLPNDDDNLKDFIALIEQNKELPSLNRNDNASKVASMKRTTAALSKYQGMRETTAVLSDSLNSSLLLHRSSSSSSRQLSNVPTMIGGTSISASSSPGKPVSPHTPHTPAIPSRLSANSIVNYNNEPRRSSSRVSSTRREGSSRDASSSDATTQGTAAIPIPLSPRPSYTRRSSSAANQPRNADEDLVFRSASLPLDDSERPDLSLSELVAATNPARAPEPDHRPNDQLDYPPWMPQEDLPLREPWRRSSTSRRDSQDDDAAALRGLASAAGVPAPSASSTAPATNNTSSPAAAAAYRTNSHHQHQQYHTGDAVRSRFSRTFASRNSSSSSLGRTPAHAATAAGAGAGASGPGASDSASSLQSGRGRLGPASRHSVEDDEGLLFTMSDMNQSRRSFEDGRGTPGSAGGFGERRRGSGWR